MKSALISLATCVLMTGTIPIPCVAADAYPVVPAVATAPIIDGLLNDAAWQDAPLFHLTTPVTKSGKPGGPVLAKMVTGPDALYFGFEVEVEDPAGPYVINSTPSSIRAVGVVCSDDVQVVLDLGRYGIFEFLTFFVNSKGEVYFCTGSPLQHGGIMEDRAMTGNSVTGAAVVAANKRSWTAELKIPYADVLSVPSNGMPKRIALNFRSLQMGSDDASIKHVHDWTGGIDEGAVLMTQRYDHMRTWHPMPSFASFSPRHNSEWAQFVFPDETGIVELRGGRIDNAIVVGYADRLKQLTLPKDIGHAPTFAGLATQPRMERREDTRPAVFPELKTKIADVKPPAPVASVTFVQRPTTAMRADGVLVSFQLSQYADAVVYVQDKTGRVIRILASGMLGPNAPAGFKPDSLRQEVLWDYKDNRGRIVPPGAYAVEVATGLKPEFVRAIAAKLDTRNDFSALLDADHIPNPKLGNLKSHDHGGGGANVMAMDHRRGEVYLPGGQVYGVETGRFLRQFKFQYKGTLQSGVQFGEVVFGDDDSLFVSGYNELWRTDLQGNPIRFEHLGKPFVADLYRCHSNPHRGHDLGGPSGDIYYLHHYTPHGNPNTQITQLESTGEIKAFGLIDLDSLTCGGIKVDSRGNIYVGTPVRPADRLLPPKLNSLPTNAIATYAMFDGSIAKFTPRGGKVVWDNAVPGLTSVRYNYGLKLQPCRLVGAEMVFPDYSPMTARPQGDSGVHCPCRSPRFELDNLDRLIVPDALMGRIIVYDTAGNRIAEIGERGMDMGKLQFRWPFIVVADTKNLFVLDFLNSAVIQVKLDYAVSERVNVSK